MLKDLLNSQLSKVVFITIFALITYYIIVYVIFGPNLFSLKEKNRKGKKDVKPVEKEDDLIEEKESFIKIIKKPKENIKNFSILADENKALNRVPEIDQDDIEINNVVLEQLAELEQEDPFLDIEDALKQFKLKEEEMDNNQNISNILDELDIDIKDDDDI